MKMNSAEFEKFRAEYIANIEKLISYSPSEVGSGVFSEKLGAMADAHPDWAEAIEETL